MQNKKETVLLFPSFSLNREQLFSIQTNLVSVFSFSLSKVNINFVNHFTIVNKMHNIPFIYRFIATGFGSGYSPIAPGTAGALVATLIWIILSFFLTDIQLGILTFFLILFFTATGIRAASAVEPVWGKDPSRVVVDEMVGVWIPLLAVPDKNGWYVAASFLLFRLFDIYKPFGIRKMERLKGGLGVMMDDIVAGIYSLILLIVARWVIG